MNFPLPLVDPQPDQDVAILWYYLLLGVVIGISLCYVCTLGFIACIIIKLNQTNSSLSHDLVSIVQEKISNIESQINKLELTKNKKIESKNIECRYYKQGDCRYGNRCWYLHPSNSTINNNITDSVSSNGLSTCTTPNTNTSIPNTCQPVPKSPNQTRQQQLKRRKDKKSKSPKYHRNLHKNHTYTNHLYNNHQNQKTQ